MSFHPSLVTNAAAFLFDPTLFNNYFSALRDTIFSVVTDNGTPFTTLGVRLFKGLAIIMIVVAGVKVALGIDHSYSKLLSVLASVMFVWAMISLYTTPSAFFGGESFSQIIPRGAFALADTVGHQTQTEMFAKLNELIAGLKQANIFSFLSLKDTIVYFLVTAAVGLLEAAMFFVVAFGYLALAAALIVGPVLIPFLMIPKLDFLFWGWFKAVVKYSFYPVIGNIVILVVCRIMLALLNSSLLVGQQTPGRIFVNVEQGDLVLVVFLIGTVAIFKIPHLVNDIFGGSASAGGSSAAVIAATVRSIV